MAGQWLFTELTEYLTPFSPKDAGKAFDALPSDLQNRVCEDIANTAGLDDYHTSLALGSTPEMAAALRELINQRMAS